jgi:cold-inducible RNA-binding protein
VAQNQRRAPPCEDNKIFVGGIHISADEEELKTFFSQFDEVVETILMRDRETGRSRGFGFVTFSSHTGVERAYGATGLNIKGKPVRKLAISCIDLIVFR